MDNSTIKIFGEGKSLRDALYVDDAVDAIIKCSLSKNAKGKSYNVGSGNPITVRKIAEEIIKACGSGKISFVDYPKEFSGIEVGDIYLSIDKIKKEIGWKPKTPFSEGIRTAAAFYKNNKKLYW